MYNTTIQRKKLSDFDKNLWVVMYSIPRGDKGGDSNDKMV